MIDKFGRNVDYMRISVTDRCNLACVYCRPRGEEFRPPAHALEGGTTPSVQDPDRPVQAEGYITPEELEILVRAAANLGFKHFRLTGGEPLIRRDIVELVSAAKRAGAEDLSITTNGTFLENLALPLKKAGLQRINVSLDTLDPERYRKITGNGSLTPVLSGIEECLKVGFDSVKVNAVVMRENVTDIKELARLTFKMPLEVRFIEVMPIGPVDAAAQDRVTLEEIKEALSELGSLTPADGLPKAGPAVTFGLAGAKGTIGFIAALSSPFCASCNRIRVTPDGNLRPCLASDIEYPILSLIRGSSSAQEALEQAVSAIQAAITQKPTSHHFGESNPHNRAMCRIGG